MRGIGVNMLFVEAASKEVELVKTSETRDEFLP